MFWPLICITLLKKQKKMQKIEEKKKKVLTAKREASNQASLYIFFISITFSNTISSATPFLRFTFPSNHEKVGLICAFCFCQRQRVSLLKMSPMSPGAMIARSLWIDFWIFIAFQSDAEFSPKTHMRLAIVYIRWIVLIWNLVQWTFKTGLAVLIKRFRCDPSKIISG